MTTEQPSTGADAATEERGTATPAPEAPAPEAPAPESETGHLTTGWEPGLELGDTLLRRFVFALAAANADPVRAMGGRILERDDVIAADLGAPNGIFNAAVLTRPLAPGEWATTMDAVEAFYADGSGDVYLFSLWPTPDLRSRGWQLEGHPPLLLRPAGPPPPPVPDDLDIREVSNGRTLADFKRVLVDGFPFAELQPFDPDAWLDERVLGLPGHRLLVGYADGDPVASGWLLLREGLAMPVLGATLPQARNRGYWRGMLSRRLQLAEGLPAATLFSDMSRPGAEHHGFLPVIRFTAWHRTRGS